MMENACSSGETSSSQQSAFSSSPTSSLTAAQKARIERNRQQALLLKNKRLSLKSAPLKKDATTKSRIDDNTPVIRVEGVKFIDSGGGFLLEQKDGEEETQKKKLVEEPAPTIEPDWPMCEECETRFDDSFLMKNFDHPVCEKCRDNDGLHSLITKTDAKNEYLLKDCDFDKREPPLRFLTRRNPHDTRWGDMKLFLQLQVEKRALEVWGSEEALEEERELREVKREKAKAKKYGKKMKELRMAVRSSLYNRITVSHEHEFGEETHVEEDIYSRTCTSCGYEEKYEKM